MDESNYQNILALARNEDDEQKVKLILNEIIPNLIMMFQIRIMEEMMVLKMYINVR